MASIVLGRGVVDLELDTRKFQSGFSRVRSIAAGAINPIGAVAGLILKPFQLALGGITKLLRGTLSFATRWAKRIGLVVAAGIGVSIKLASDAQETLSKFDAVFKDQGDAAARFASDLGAAIGRSDVTIKGFLATLQDTFVPLGFSRRQARGLSEAMTQLAFDLGSFNNMNTDEVVNLLTSALVGNHEAVRRFGVIITQASLNQELLNIGIAGGVKNATEQQKVLARLNIIMRSTVDAQGDAVRTADQFANQMRALKDAVFDVGRAIGDVFIGGEGGSNFLKGLISSAQALAKVIKSNADTIREFIFGIVESVFSFIQRIFSRDTFELILGVLFKVGEFVGGLIDDAIRGIQKIGSVLSKALNLDRVEGGFFEKLVGGLLAIGDAIANTLDKLIDELKIQVFNLTAVDADVADKRRFERAVRRGSDARARIREATLGDRVAAIVGGFRGEGNEQGGAAGAIGNFFADAKQRGEAFFAKVDALFAGVQGLTDEAKEALKKRFSELAPPDLDITDFAAAGAAAGGGRPRRRGSGALVGLTALFDRIQGELLESEAERAQKETAKNTAAIQQGIVDMVRLTTGMPAAIAEALPDQVATLG